MVLLENWDQLLGLVAENEVKSKQVGVLFVFVHELNHRASNRRVGVESHGCDWGYYSGPQSPEETVFKAREKHYMELLV